MVERMPSGMVVYGYGSCSAPQHHWCFMKRAVYAAPGMNIGPGLLHIELATAPSVDKDEQSRW